MVNDFARGWGVSQSTITCKKDENLLRTVLLVSSRKTSFFVEVIYLFGILEYRFLTSVSIHGFVSNQPLCVPKRKLVID